MKWRPGRTYEGYPYLVLSETQIRAFKRYGLLPTLAQSGVIVVRGSTLSLYETENR